MDRITNGVAVALTIEYILGSCTGIPLNHTLAGPNQNGTPAPVELIHHVEGPEGNDLSIDFARPLVPEVIQVKGDASEPLSVRLEGQLVPERMIHEVNINLDHLSTSGNGASGIKNLIEGLDRAAQRWSPESLSRVLELRSLSGLGVPSWAHARLHYELKSRSDERMAAWGKVYANALSNAHEADDSTLASRMLKTLETSKMSSREKTAALGAINSPQSPQSSEARNALGRIACEMLANREGATTRPIWLDFVVEWPPDGQANIGEAQATAQLPSTPNLRLYGLDGYYRDVERNVYAMGDAIDESEGTLFHFWMEEEKETRGVAISLEKLLNGESLVIHIRHEAFWASNWNKGTQVKADELDLSLRAEPRPDGTWRIGGQILVRSSDSPENDGILAMLVLIPWEGPR